MSRHFKTSLFMIIGGLAAIIVGLFISASLKRQMARDTEPATATVIDYYEEEDTSTDGGSDIEYYPIVTYEVDGKTIESQYGQYEYDKIYELQSTVEIKYDPDNPSEFYIVGDDNMSSGIPLSVIAGGILLLIGLARILVPMIMAMRSR